MNNNNRYSFDTIAKNFLISTMRNEDKARFLELLKTERRGREDIIYFSEELLGVPLNDYQKRWLSRTTTPRSKWMEVFGDVIEDIGGFLFGSNISSIGNQCIEENEYIYTRKGISRVGDLKQGDETLTGI